MTTLACYHEEISLLDVAKNYLAHLLEGKRINAYQVIREALRNGLSIRDLYITIFQPVQYEVGRLWLLNKVSVAEEHFCTAATQSLMLELYPEIISSHRTGTKLVSACVGPELHEIGVRMVTDFFEMDGWDTWYLGAAISNDQLISAIHERNPDIVALSATMSYHVPKVTELVAAIKEAFPVKAPHIMVGGVPFNAVPDLWRTVGADLWAVNADRAVQVAREALNL